VCGRAGYSPLLPPATVTCVVGVCVCLIDSRGAGGSNNNNYANIELIADIAERCGASTSASQPQSPSASLHFLALRSSCDVMRCGVMCAGAHAVWAGWGHASENPKLPECLAKTKSKVIWIGPPPSAMRALGLALATSPFPLPPLCDLICDP
jgi:hypothetical protein